MPSRPETRLLPIVGRRFALSALSARIALFVLIAIAAPTPGLRADGAPPTAAEITQAIETVKKDPNLDASVKVKTLQWKDKTKPQKKPDWALLEWLRDLMRWFERSMRLFMWIGVAILACWLVISILRLVRGRGPRRAADDEFVAPTHVRDLDIRPEALPRDIGAAARALWDRGRQREALALLYRGLLSRLAHVHRVPIRDSSTEGDCLALAGVHLKEPSRRDYTSRLIQVWQRAVYGRQDPPAATVHDLCDAFARALDRAPAAAAAPGHASAAAVSASGSHRGGQA